MGEYETNYNPSDDLYSIQSNNPGPPQLATGRLPCSTLTQALNWVENINQYINHPTSGLWRNKVFLTGGYNLSVDGQSPYYMGLGFSFSNVYSVIESKITNKP